MAPSIWLRSSNEQFRWAHNRTKRVNLIQFVKIDSETERNGTVQYFHFYFRRCTKSDGFLAVGQSAHIAADISAFHENQRSSLECHFSRWDDATNETGMQNYSLHQLSQCSGSYILDPNFPFILLNIQPIVSEFLHWLQQKVRTVSIVAQRFAMFIFSATEHGIRHNADCRNATRFSEILLCAECFD